MIPTAIPSSFRDPAGFVFHHKGEFYRRVAPTYLPTYKTLMACGLYHELREAGLLIEHQEVSMADMESSDTILLPRQVPFISYPYEWSFSQLKDAALATLDIQRRALEHGLSLKDASAFNIQFLDGRPCLIDTLSFEAYEEGRPWVAYKQFCEHFLAPLALMAMVDVRLNSLLLTNIDGIPLSLAAKMLPVQSWITSALGLHLLLHAKTQSKMEAAGSINSNSSKFSLTALKGLVANLEECVRILKLKETSTVWTRYLDDNTYSAQASEHKQTVIKNWISQAAPHTVFDLGANVGIYSRIAAECGAQVVSMEQDAHCAEHNYLQCRLSDEKKILPLVVNLTAPSPAVGWLNQEREALVNRGRADMVLSLALIHHLAIANNIPLQGIARMLKSMGEKLIIEFVPKTDSQVQRLLANRRDIFQDYDEKGFEDAFRQHFTMLEKVEIQDSGRTLYLFQSKDNYQ